MKRKMKAYLTVEVTLLFPVILMMVMTMMGLSFYVYDRCVIKQCVYDALLTGAREGYVNSQQRKDSMQEKIEESLQDQAIALEEIEIYVDAGIQKVSITVKGKTSLLWLSWVDLPITVQEELRCFHTVKLMRLYSVGKDLIE